MESTNESLEKNIITKVPTLRNRTKHLSLDTTSKSETKIGGKSNKKGGVNCTSPSKAGSGYDFQNSNSWEGIIKNSYPPTRAYHSTFMYDKKIFIFGGKDISKNYMDDVWSLDCRQMWDMNQGNTEFLPNP